MKSTQMQRYIQDRRGNFSLWAYEVSQSFSVIQPCFNTYLSSETAQQFQTQTHKVQLAREQEKQMVWIYIIPWAN